MYGAADAFLLPTRHLEGFGLIVIEALACATPVLAARTGAPVEILEPFPEMLAKDNSDASFVDLVLSWLQEGRRRDATELVRHVEESYSFSAVGPRLLELVEEVVARCSGWRKKSPAVAPNNVEIRITP
jgi:glycosyltransferase involved in cell wall biosynthesis